MRLSRLPFPSRIRVSKRPSRRVRWHRPRPRVSLPPRRRRARRPRRPRLPSTRRTPPRRPNRSARASASARRRGPGAKPRRRRTR